MRYLQQLFFYKRNDIMFYKIILMITLITLYVNTASALSEYGNTHRPLLSSLSSYKYIIAPIINDWLAVPEQLHLNSANTNTELRPKIEEICKEFECHNFIFLSKKGGATSSAMRNGIKLLKNSLIRSIEKKNLRKLQLCGINFSLPSFQISSQSNISFLDLSNTDVNSENLVGIESLRCLVELNLFNTNIREDLFRKNSYSTLVFFPCLSVLTLNLERIASDTVLAYSRCPDDEFPYFVTSEFYHIKMTEEAEGILGQLSKIKSLAILHIQTLAEFEKKHSLAERKKYREWDVKLTSEHNYTLTRTISE